MAVPVGDGPAEIGIPFTVSDQQDRPVAICRKLASQNGSNTHLLRGLKEQDQSVYPVCIGQGQSVHPLLHGGAAEFFDGADTPALGIVRMDIKMNEIGHGSKFTVHQDG